MSPNTVTNNFDSLMQRLGSSSREQAIAFRAKAATGLARNEASRQQGSWRAEKNRCASGKVNSAEPTAAGCLYWFDRWAWTYDPRLARSPGGAYVKFSLWPKQADLVIWLVERILAGGIESEGLVEKSRDVGASYVCCGVLLWCWLFVPGFKGTIASRKTDFVDKKGNPDALLPKIRIMLDRLPPELLPDGFSRGKHDTYMRLINPASGGSITGEGGDEIGRGGRSTVVVLDEAAFVEDGEGVERAISGNTDVAIWVSSVNGMGNFFAQKRFRILKPSQIFRLHWKDDPRKTPEWAAAKKASYTDPTGWASEYDIDYSASVEGICIPAAWVESCKIIAQLEPRLIASTVQGATGLDVGAGKAKSVAISRRGGVVDKPEARGEPDTTGTALWGIEQAKLHASRRLKFDSPGVGAGVSSTLSHNPTPGLAIDAINTGLPPDPKRLWPDGRTSDETFGNMKAEIWWLCRTAAQRTHQHVLFLQGVSVESGAQEYPISELLSLPSGDSDSDQLCLEMSMVKYFRNEKGKLVIESKQQLATRGIKSPDYADALMLTWAPDQLGPMVITDEMLTMVRRAGVGSHGHGRRARLG